MNPQITITVSDIIGTPLCISSGDGQRIFDKLAPLIEEGRQVTVSFNGTTTLISLFLNAAIGQLYGKFSEEKINAYLKIAGLADDDLELLKCVIDNAKQYYTNQKGYDDAWSSEGHDDEE